MKPQREMTLLERWNSLCARRENMSPPLDDFDREVEAVFGLLMIRVDALWGAYLKDVGRTRAGSAAFDDIINDPHKF